MDFLFNFQLYPVFFYLYTCDEAESVSICAPNNRVIALQEHPPGQKHCWSNRQPFCASYDLEHFEYRYRAKFKRHVLKRFFKWVVEWDNSIVQVITEETVHRLTNETNHFDIFHLPGTSDKQHKAILSGVLHFVDKLYHHLSEGSDFRQTLADCERICCRLSWTEKKDLTEISKWIDKVTRCRIQWYHSAYVCSLIGQVEKACHAGGIVSVMQPKTANALLDLLPAFNFEFIPQKSMAYIKSIAINLFPRSSKEGWLAFLTYFAKMLEVEKLLCTAQKLPMSYADEHFNYHITYLGDLLVSLTEADDQVKVLEFVMDRCMSVACLWHLHQELSTHFPELTDALAGRFSQRFCQLIFSHTRTTPKVDLLQRNVWKEMPRELRSSLADSFVKALQHQIAEETDLSTDRRITLKTYISDREICSSKHFVPFILGLANNKSEPVFSVLVDIMDCEQFSETWWVLSHSERSDICKCLLRNIAGSSSQKNVVQVLKAVRMIGESRALQCDEETQRVLKKCATEMLQNVNLQVMLAAYVDLDHSSQIMESCYSLLLREIVKQKRMTSDHDSSLIKRLLLYLDVKGKKNQSDLPSVELPG